MGTESFEAVTQTGEPVRVEFDPDACELTITVGSQVVRPAWGSQAFDDYYDIGGPTSFGSPGRGPSEDETLRYDKRAYFATDGRVSGWVITSERAETPRAWATDATSSSGVIQEQTAHGK